MALLFIKPTYYWNTIFNYNLTLLGCHVKTTQTYLVNIANIYYTSLPKDARMFSVY